jgi:hypothetical protein
MATTSDIPKGFINTYDPDAPTPEVGSKWLWANDQPNYPFGNRENVTVTEVKWNGEEWWVRTTGPRGLFWTDVNVFWEGVRKKKPSTRVDRT